VAEETANVHLRDEGTLCLGAPREAGDADRDAASSSSVEVTANHPLAVAVRSACLSGSCATNRAARCSVKREGSRVVVTSDLSWTAPTAIDRFCSQDCTPLEATCATDALPPGAYTFVLGGTTHEVMVPSTLADPCFGAAPTAPAAAVASASPAPASLPQVVAPDDVPAAPGTGVAPEPPPKDLVCFGPLSQVRGRTMKAGQPIAITVFKKNPCVAAACTGAPAKCTVKRKGSHLVLDAQFPLPNAKPVRPCTEDCPGFAATCKTDALPAGTYTIEHGLQRETVVVPGTPPPCGQ